MADNVIKAVFASGRRVKAAPLWRYDHGIRLQPIGLELPDNYEMHFSNSKTGEAKTVLADASGAVIPAEYLIPGTEVYAWIYLAGDSYGRTKAEIIIPVDAKARPTDQEPTPEQQPVIEQAIDALNDAQDALEEATSHIIESGITPAEREKLAGIEAGAEVNVIEEVRAFDILRGYVPLPVTDKGVNLPKYREPDNLNDVVYFDFGIDAEGNVTQYEFPDPMIDAVNQHGQTVIARVKFANDSFYYLLPLTHMDGYDIRFTGFTGTAEKLEIRWDTNFHKWRAQFTELVDWDSADNSYVWANQGSANSGKVLTVGSDGKVAPQDAAGGDNVFVAAYGVTTQEELEAAYQAGKALFCDYVQPNAPEIVRRLSLFTRYSNGADYYFYFTGVEVDPGDIITEFIASCGVGALDAWQIQKINSPLPNPNPRQNPAALGTASPGTSTYYSRHDHVHQMPSAADVGAVTANQGTAHAGEFLVVGSDGNVTTKTMSAWQGGNY